MNSLPNTSFVPICIVFENVAYPLSCNEYPNACGAHIHNGTSCETTTTQGGHLYNMSTVSIDPWINERYSSNDNGYASFSNTMQMGTNDVLGKPFISKYNIVSHKDGPYIYFQCELFL